MLASVHDFVKAEGQWDGMFAVSWISSLCWSLKEIILIVLAPPLDRLEEDRFVQNFTLDGMFSTKSACQLVQDHVNQVHGDQVWKKL